MKTKLLLSFVLLILFYIIPTVTSCSIKEEELETKVDTIPINIKGVPLHFLKYKKLNYALFATGKFIDGIPEEHFYIFTDDGELMDHSDDTEVLNYTFHKDLHVKNDSIIVKIGFNNSSSFYWDSGVSKWLPAKSVDDVIYEDDKYYITSLDFGEWGGGTWFKDKRTGQEYQIDITTPEVHKPDNSFYLINNDLIVKIDNPHDLNKIDTAYYYKNIKNGNLDRFRENNERYFLQGAKILYQRVRSLYNHTQKFYIAKTFTSNNQLFHVIEDNGKVYIATLSNGDLKPVKNLDKGISFFKNENSFRNYYLNEAVLFCKKEADTSFGYMEIKDNVIKLHYFKQPQ